MGSITLIMLVLVSGCDRWQSCEDRAWTLATAGTTHVDIALAPDGTYVVATAGGTLGDQLLDGPSLARITSDGVIDHVAMAVAASGLGDGVFPLRIDPQGRIVLAGHIADGIEIAAYDATFALRWQLAVTAGTTFPGYAFDVSSSGTVAFSAGDYGTEVGVIDDTGIQRWRITVPGSVQALRISNTGDVIALGALGEGEHLWLLAGADGAVLTDQARPTLPYLGLPPYLISPVLVDPDGGVLISGLSEGKGEIRWLDPIGVERWRHPIDGRRVASLLRSTNGDVLALIYRQIDVRGDGNALDGNALALRIDADTGATLAETEVCGGVLGATDESGLVTVPRACSCERGALVFCYSCQIGVEAQGSPDIERFDTR